MAAGARRAVRSHNRRLGSWATFEPTRAAKSHFTPEKPPMTPKLIAILALGVPLLDLLSTLRDDTLRPTHWPYDPPFNPLPGH